MTAPRFTSPLSSSAASSPPRHRQHAEVPISTLAYRIQAEAAAAEDVAEEVEAEVGDPCRLQETADLDLALMYTAQVAVDHRAHSLRRVVVADTEAGRRRPTRRGRGLDRQLAGREAAVEVMNVPAAVLRASGEAVAPVAEAATDCTQ